MPFRTPRSPQSTEATPPTRHSLSAHRRRIRRRRVTGIAGAATAVAVLGTGVLTGAASGSAFGIPATAQATSAVSDALGIATPRSTADSDVTVVDSDGGRVSVHAGSFVPRSTANTVAQIALSSGKATESSAARSVDTSKLTASLTSLADYRELDADTVLARVGATQAAADAVSVATDTAEAKAAAKKAAAVAAAERAEQAAADAARQAAANTPDGAKATARALMASQYGWGGDQYGCLVSLWAKESGWNYRAYNASGATGIPQALPGSKMASVSSDWATNATTQVIWGLGYISGSYGTPCAAWSHSQANNWY